MFNDYISIITIYIYYIYIKYIFIFYQKKIKQGKKDTKTVRNRTEEIE